MTGEKPRVEFDAPKSLIDALGNTLECSVEDFNKIRPT